MDLFPTSYKPLVGYRVAPFYSTLTTREKTGKDISIRKASYPRFLIEQEFRVSLSSADVLTQFFEDQCGRYKEFDFFDHISRSWEGAYIGVTDGTTTEFDLPCTDVAIGDFDFYLDGTLVTKPYIGVSYSTDGGTNGRGRLSYTVAPTTGQVLTCDFTGKRAFRVRFKSDELTLDLLQTWSGTSPMVSLELPMVSQL
jgi:hypothetical protein